METKCLNCQRHLGYEIEGVVYCKGCNHYNVFEGKIQRVFLKYFLPKSYQNKFHNSLEKKMGDQIKT